MVAPHRGRIPDAVRMGSEYVLLRPHINRHYTRGPPNVMVRADRRMTSDGMRAARGTVIQEPAAWIGADIQNDRTWIHQLDARALAEIDAALVHAKRVGARIPFGRDAFPLARFKDELDAILHEVENGRG